MDFLLEETYQLRPCVENTQSLVGPEHGTQSETTDDLIGPALIFIVKQGHQTFTIQGKVCKDLESELHFSTSVEQKQNFLNEQKLKIFPLGYPELGEVIIDQIFNRNFPTNLNDFYALEVAGLNWWGYFGNEELIIHYGPERPKNENIFCPLGPLGDWKIANYQFESFSLENNGLYLDKEQGRIKLEKKSTTSKIFDEITGMFLKGKYDRPLSNDKSQFQLYLAELSAIRRFWISLSDSQKFIH